jgi:sigma-B regulation protein RsbU (phosphoserine phosphatase)
LLAIGAELAQTGMTKIEQGEPSIDVLHAGCLPVQCPMRIRQLYELWRSCCKPYGVPVWDDFNREDLSRWRGSYGVYEGVSGNTDFRYQAVGKKLVEEAGINLTGYLISERSYTAGRQEAFQNLLHIVKKHVPRYRFSSEETLHNVATLHDRIFLPFSSTGEEIDIILFYVDKVERHRVDAEQIRNRYSDFGEEVFSSSILIVDDDEMMREVVKILLEEGGYTNLKFAEDGYRALELVELSPPDLVILDMNMPVMDGFEVLQAIRANENFSDLPVLVTTALKTNEARNGVLGLGATKLISKPFDGTLLLQQASDLLEREWLLRKLQQFNERLEYELAAAREVQEETLPTAEYLDEIQTLFDCDLKSHYQPSSELGGDFWGAKIIDQDRLMLYLVDFSGHGVASALNTIRLHTIIGEGAASLASPAAFLGDLNNQLVDILPIGQFATMLCVLVDFRRAHLTYAAAAAPEPVFGDRTNGSFRFEDGSGLLLGTKKDAQFENREIDFPPGSFLFLYSDALLENPCKSGPPLFQEGVAKLLESAVKPGTLNPIESLLEQFEEQAAFPLRDDLSLVYLSH